MGASNFSKDNFSLLKNKEKITRHIKQNNTKKAEIEWFAEGQKKIKNWTQHPGLPDSDDSILQASAQELTDTHKSTHTEVGWIQ